MSSPRSHLSALLLVVALVAGCGRGRGNGGSISLDGRPVTIRSCHARAMNGQAIVVLYLSSDLVLELADRGGRTVPRLGLAGAAPVELTCEQRDADLQTTVANGEATARGRVTLRCSGAAGALVASLTLDC
jgi:hypothetical protein